LGSGANAYGLVRSLGEAGMRPVVADDHRGPVFFSRLVAGRWLLPSLTEGAAVAGALAARLARLGAEAFVIPTNEPWVHILNRHRHELGPRLQLPLASPQVVEMTLRKSAMHRWCLRHGVVQPETMVFEPGRDWAALLAWAEARLPVIIKPDTKGLGDEALGFPTAEFHSASQLRRWGREWGLVGPPCTILAQRFLPAPGVSLSAWQGYRSPGGSLFMAGISKLRSRPPRLGGCATAWVFSAGEASRQAAVHILEALDYSGFFDLEFLIRPGGVPPVFIELNPRPGMPNYAATIMGLNLPLLGLAHCRGQGPRTSRIVTGQPGRWVDMISDPVLALSGATAGGRRWTLRQWLASLRPGPLVDAHANWRDPLVFLAACARLLALGIQHAVHQHGPGKGKSGAGDLHRKLGIWARLKHRVKGLRDQVRAIGPVRAALAAVTDIFWRKAFFYQQDLRSPLVAPTPLPGLTWRRIGPDDALVLAAINPAQDSHGMQRRLAQGQTGWVFFLANEPAHCRWEATGTTYLYEMDVALALGPGEVTHVAGYTRYQHRRLGISTFSRALLLATARERGCRRVIVGTPWWNRPSMRSCQEISHLQPLGSLTRYGFGRFVTLRVTGNLALNGQGQLVVKLP